VDLERRRGHTTLTTSDGIEISARHVIPCTGYELAKIVPPSGNQILSTLAITTRPQTKALWPQKALMWEASDPYLYVRATRDGRPICGGVDEEFSDAAKRNSLLPVKTKRIERRLHRLFPKLDSRSEIAWTGSFGGSPNGMPTIGEIPGHRRCYAVMGYGGNGITFSMLAAQLITSAVLGRKNPDAPLFAF
jgi:glycine/D-amino acid oxidase-like deaminating enzyme